MNVNKPISYEEFKNLNEEFKKLYISHLMNTYGATTYEIANMMDTTPSILCKYLYLHHINAKSLNIIVSKDTLDKKGWKKFVKGELVAPVVSKDEKITTNKNDNIKIPNTSVNIESVTISGTVESIQKTLSDLKGYLGNNTYTVLITKKEDK